MSAGRAWRLRVLASLRYLLFALLSTPCAAADLGARLQVQVGHTDQTTFMFATCAAYSSDGRYLVTGGMDKTARLWEAGTGVELRAFRAGAEPVSFVAVSAGARYVMTSAGDDGLKLWDGRTGAELRRFRGAYEGAFSNDGSRLLVPGPGPGGVRVVDVATGRTLATLRGAMGTCVATADAYLGLTASGLRAWDAKTHAPLWSLDVEVADEGIGVVFADGGAHAVIQESETAVRIVELPSGREVARFADHGAPLTAIAISADGSRVATATDRPEGLIRVFDVRVGASPIRTFEEGYESFGLLFAGAGDALLTLHRTGDISLRRVSDGETERRYQGLVDLAWPAAYAPSGRYAVGRGLEAITIWDLTTGGVARRIAAEPDTPLGDVPRIADGRAALVERPDGAPDLYRPPAGSELASAGASPTLSPDLRLAITTDGEEGDAKVALWDAATGKRLHEVPGTSPLLSADGRKLAVERAGAVEIWDVAPRARTATIRVAGSPAAISPDGAIVAIEGPSSILLADTRRGTVVRRVAHRRGDLSSVRFSPDGERIAAGGDDGVVVWSVATGWEVSRIRPDTFYTTVEISFSPDGQFLLTGGAGPARIWRVATGEEVCMLAAFRDGTWAVVEPGGRFDTDALDGTRGLYWLAPDAPLTPLPIEIFMREFYEPRLLPRLLAGASFAPVRDLSSIDRTQPEVRILDVAPSAEGLLTVRVRVAGKAGARDLRLFRDGQLVGYVAKPGSDEIVFDRVRIPRREGIDRVTISAYAFNDDGVKSATERREVAVPPGLAPVRGRAFVVAVGVDEYGVERLNLRFAANDAREIVRVAGGSLEATGAFDAVVPVLLTAERGTPGGATREAIRAAIERLRDARPEDVVLLAFAGHGFADERGGFYLVPSDAAAEGASLASIRARCISSDDLALWLREVDAGEMVLVVDACQSAASVEGEGFKPGPMGSRGLGQLAYDKGMKVLAATQADNVAAERKGLEHGLLTYALLEGIESRAADFRPNDGAVLLREWLEYGVFRVPALAAPGGPVRLFVQEDTKRPRPPQRPALFDFSRRPSVAVVSGR